MSTEPDAGGGIPARTEGKPRLSWHAVPPEEVARYWGGTVAGLTESEAATRLARLGQNRLEEAPPPPLWKRFVAQVSDFTVLALLAAALVAGLLAVFWPEPGVGFVERYGDSLAILAIVILNAVLGLAQAARAEKALAALKEMTAPTARVERGGRTLDVPAAELVPGDIVLLEAGDRAAADARLISGHELTVEEGALTGESLPVDKDPHAVLAGDTPLAERRTMIYMGTRVANGRARAIVTNTGMYTELGSIAGMLARVEPDRTPLEQELERFGKRVVLGCVAVSAIVFVAGMLFAHQSARELFLVAVALAVAAIPEGLPAVTTIVLALGTTRMAARNALVRRLPAVETLGSAQVICTDKTGTLTQNAMSVRELWIGGTRLDVEGAARSGDVKLRGPEGEVAALGGETSDVGRTLHAAAHAVGAKIVPGEGGALEVMGDPTDGALVALAWRLGEKAHAPVVSEQPFTSQRRMASVIVTEDGVRRSYVRGAPEAVLERSQRFRQNGQDVELAPGRRLAIADEAARWAARALRVIALAVRDVPSEGSVDAESDLTFLALVGISDPPRPEVKGAIAEARAAGISTIMITGDHPATGRAIAQEIGLWQEGDLILTGGELDAKDQQKLVEEIERVRVVARATAEHKLRIVEALRARGKVCAMTGDGINDAPAVKAASIGVAMGRAGTDVTKEAAALVLADDNYATIVAAVEEGRALYANIKKFIFFLLSSNAGAVLLVLTAALLGWETPLAPIQILWINLITNGLPALALGVDTRDPDQMKQPPRPPGGAVLNGREYLEMLVVGVVMAATAGWAYHHFMVKHEMVQARTVCFGILAVGPLLHAFNCRSKTKSIFSLGLFSNRALWGATAIGILLEALAIYVPAMRPIFRTGDPGLDGLAWMSVMSIAPVVFGELVKLFGGPPSAQQRGGGV